MLPLRNAHDAKQGPDRPERGSFGLELVAVDPRAGPGVLALDTGGGRRADMRSLDCLGQRQVAALGCYIDRRLISGDVGWSADISFRGRDQKCLCADPDDDRDCCGFRRLTLCGPDWTSDFLDRMEPTRRPLGHAARLCCLPTLQDIL